MMMASQIRLNAALNTQLNVIELRCTHILINSIIRIIPVKVKEDPKHKIGMTWGDQQSLNVIGNVTIR